MTYELVVPCWPDALKAAAESRTEIDFAPTFDSIGRIVFFRSLDKVEDRNTRIVRGNIRDEIMELKREHGKPILVSGVDLPSQLIELGLADEFRFVIGPALAEPDALVRRSQSAGKNRVEGCCIEGFPVGICCCSLSETGMETFAATLPPGPTEDENNRKEGTVKYICLGYYDKVKRDGMTEAARNALYDSCFDYDDHLRANGHWIGGKALQPQETALTLRGKDRKVAVTDGPYTESKEQIGGIVVIEARDMNHAVQFMSQHPTLKYGNILEIRPAGNMSKILKASEQRRRLDTDPPANTDR